MGWLLDTNVISEIRKLRPSARVLNFIHEQDLNDVYISVVTVAEIRFGIEILVAAEKRAELTDWLSYRVRPMFANWVLAVNEAILLRWRLLLAEGRKKGHIFSQPDLMLAATAAEHGLTVVSRDTSQFEKAGVAVLNPW